MTTSSRPQQVYEQWAGAAGNITDYTPWDQLPTDDQKRWVWFAKVAHIDAWHKRSEIVPADVKKFGTDSSKNWNLEVLSFADFDHGYELWLQGQINAYQRKKWQFWREPLPAGHLTFFNYSRLNNHGPIDFAPEPKLKETYRSATALWKHAKTKIIETYGRINTPSHL